MEPSAPPMDMHMVWSTTCLLTEKVKGASDIPIGDTVTHSHEKVSYLYLI
jgi:hypothetical protein